MRLILSFKSKHEQKSWQKKQRRRETVSVFQLTSYFEKIMRFKWELLTIVHVLMDLYPFFRVSLHVKISTCGTILCFRTGRGLRLERVN